MIIDDQGLLAFDPNLYPKPVFDKVKDDLIENLDKEFQVLGLMVSGSPLEKYKKEIKESKAIKIEEIAESKGNFKVFAIVKAVRKRVTKKSETMAYITVYDETSDIELTVFPETYLKSSKVLKKNNLVVIDGYLRVNGEVSVQNIVDIKEFVHE